eukprot:3969202-Pleurochrysis_carterae.AAC.1
MQSRFGRDVHFGLDPGVVRVEGMVEVPVVRELPFLSKQDACEPSTRSRYDHGILERVGTQLWELTLPVAPGTTVRIDGHWRKQRGRHFGQYPKPAVHMRGPEPPPAVCQPVPQSGRNPSPVVPCRSDL